MTMTEAAYTSTTPFTVPTLPPVEAFYFSLVVTCFIVGTVGNALALRYFLNKKRDIPTTIYIFITIVDITVSVLILPTGIPLLRDNRRGWILQNTIICNIWGIMWQVFSITTIFLVATLSVTRTIYMVAPFRELSKRGVVAAIVAYITFLLVQATIPLWKGASYEYWHSLSLCDWYAEDVLMPDHPTAALVYSQIFLFENYFPLFFILASCCITLCSLQRSDNRAINQSNRAVTTTILLFTALFVVCNTPPTLVYIVSTIHMNTGTLVIDTSWDWKYNHFFQFQRLYCVSINSAVNPVLYMCRMPSLRRSTVAMWRRKVPDLSKAVTTVLSWSAAVANGTSFKPAFNRTSLAAFNRSITVPSLDRPVVI